MAKPRRLIASRFFKRVEASRFTYEAASGQAKELIKDILLNNPALIHAISARCKDSASLWLKLCEKEYGQPNTQITDIVAARVITYYKDHVPIVVTALSDALEINLRKSIDKEQLLEAVEFGYTSVHLIARTKGSWESSPKYSALRGKWFEIQVRSILEHAWAEIEHEVVYKSGINYPTRFKRRFARIAGAIEILDGEFAALRDYQQSLISGYKSLYENGQDLAVEIDSARLIALLECERPDSLGWRKASELGTPFPPHIVHRCLKAMMHTGIRTGRALKSALRSKQLIRAEFLFSRENRLSDQVSHLVTARLVVLLENPTVFGDYFPELLSDPAFAKVFETRRKQKQ
jgi:ppGpp synthetase/RelA/SpoT-type nucleotidyltranferase